MELTLAPPPVHEEIGLGELVIAVAPMQEDLDVCPSHFARFAP